MWHWMVAVVGVALDSGSGECGTGWWQWWVWHWMGDSHRSRVGVALGPALMKARGFFIRCQFQHQASYS